MIEQRIGELQEILSQVEDIRAFLEERETEEQIKYENICDNGLEASPIGEALAEAVEALEQAYTEADEAHTCLENAIMTLEEAVC